jgi:DnaJ family protein A protein 2
MDGEKRKLYDRYGEKALGGDGGGGPRSQADMFAQMFGGGFGGGHSHGGGSRRRKGEDKQIDYEVTMKDLYNGKDFEIKVTRKRLCMTCYGKGAEDEDAIQRCGACKGRGQVVRLIRRGPMVMQQAVLCSDCEGRGEQVDEKRACVTCKGRKTTENEKTLHVAIQPGMRFGETVQFEGEADQIPDVETGDVLVRLVPVGHGKAPADSDDEDSDDDDSKDQKMTDAQKSASKTPEFKRVGQRGGADLLIEKELTLIEALCGFEFSFKHLDDRVVLVRSPKGHVTNHEDIMILDNEGFPRRGSPEDKGRLFIKFAVKLPSATEMKQLGAQKTAQLAALLPQKAPKPASDVSKAKKALTPKMMPKPDPAAQQRARQQQRGGGGGGGPGGVECATQ